MREELSFGREKLVPLAHAIRTFVEPGMHLNFASTPSRSNAAVLELARAFRGQNPNFELSSTGFHSALHLLAVLRLGRRYIGCFFGDNYPTPRPHALYDDLLREGHEIEHWSLWSYVSALAAAAHGQRYAITRSLSGTSLAKALAERGKYFEVPDPGACDTPLGLVHPLEPDIVFLHAPAGDAQGNVVFSPPHGEGFSGALAARRGVIVTLERVLSSQELRQLPHLMPLPAHRVLAVCEAPGGAHPQPLHVAPRELAVPCYDDDYAAYLHWRELAEDARMFSQFEQRVLAATDLRSAYWDWFGSRARNEPASVEPERIRALDARELAPSDVLVLLAGRTLVRRLQAAPHRAILAGIGHAFAAARFAKLSLEPDGGELELMIETGFAGFDAERADPFLLSRRNVAAARRLTSVENMLGTLCCGGAAACLGVIGAAQVDIAGNINSTFSQGQLLVGAGGATDIAAAAREVVVLTRADPRRLVREVDYVTSVGRNVRSIVTDACVFERKSPSEPWVVRDILASRADGLRQLLQSSGFSFVFPGPPPIAEPPSARELALLASVRWGASLQAEGNRRG
jgi:3-oxoacid CoA-transferase subunit A